MQDFSNILEGKKQVVKGRSLRIGSDGFLGKAFGVAITSIMICGFCGSIFMGWMIRDGLTDLANTKNIKSDLLRIQQELVEEKKELLTQENVETIAGGLGLYPVSNGQVRHF